VYGYNDRYRGISGGRHVLFMCADDVAAHRLEAGQKVDITSHFEDAERTVRSFTIVPYQIPKGCVAAYFPEANELFPLASVAARSGTPTTKCIVVTVAPSNE
jgi:anaerobic selenocysteine-containing dehydrogenase